MKQLELFDNLGTPGEGKRFRKEDKNIHKLLRFKTWIFLTIYSILILIIGFTLGVEQGKKITTRGKKIEVKQRTKQEVQTDELPDKKIAPVKPKQRPTTDTTLTLKTDDNKYAIQLASLKDLTSAEKEIEKLKKTGFNAYSKHSGKFIVVLVGPFPTEKEAQRQLKKLKLEFKDCFIKKIN